MKKLKEFLVLITDLAICAAVVLIVSCFGKSESEDDEDDESDDIALELKKRLNDVVKKAEACSQVRVVSVREGKGYQRVTVRWADGEKILEAMISHYQCYTVETITPLGTEKYECSGINHMLQISESLLKGSLSVHLIEAN